MNLVNRKRASMKMYLISSTVLFVLTFEKKRIAMGDEARASSVQTDQFYERVDLFEMKM